MSLSAGSRSSVAALIGALLVMAIDDLVGARLGVFDQFVRERRRADTNLRRDGRAVEEDDAMAHTVAVSGWVASRRRASATMASGVMPKCWYSTSAGPEAPKPVMPTKPP